MVLYLRTYVYKYKYTYKSTTTENTYMYILIYYMDLPDDLRTDKELTDGII